MDVMSYGLWVMGNASKTQNPLPKTQNLWPLAVLLLFFSGCVTTTGGQQLTVPPVFQLWLAVAVVLLMISLALMLLVYMFGNLLMNERMKAWAKMELFEIIYSAIILVFALYMVGAADSVVQGLVRGSDPYSDCICAPNFPQDASGNQIPGTIYSGIQECHIRLAIYFLHTLFKETNDQALQTYLSYIWTATLADAQLTIENVFEMAGMFTFTPWRGFLAMHNIIKSEVFEKMIMLMMLTMFQEQMIRFIAMAIYPVLFVMGIVLRAFTFTRRLGGLLMALALSLFFIYPMFYAFGALIINKIKVNQFDPNNPEDPPVAARLYVNGVVPLPTGQNFDLAQEERNTRLIAERLSRVGLCPPMRVDRALSDAAARAANDPNSQPPRFTLFRDPNAPLPTAADAEEARQKSEEWFNQVSRKNWWLSPRTLFSPGGFIDILARLAFFSVFFGLLGILATIAAIKNLSILFGGETEIAGLTHLI